MTKHMIVIAIDETDVAIADTIDETADLPVCVADRKC